MLYSNSYIISWWLYWFIFSSKKQLHNGVIKISNSQASPLCNVMTCGSVLNEYLFVSKKGGEYIPATVSTANTLASKISEVGGVDFYSHSGRHFFATLLKRKNFPDDIIVQIFSWSDSSMIKVYNQDSDLRFYEWKLLSKSYFSYFRR